LLKKLSGLGGEPLGWTLTMLDKPGLSHINPVSKRLVEGVRIDALSICEKLDIAATEFFGEFLRCTYKCRTPPRRGKPAGLRRTPPPQGKEPIGHSA